MKSNVFNYKPFHKPNLVYGYANNINKIPFKLMIFTALLFVMALSACKKDKGNYDLTDVNDIAVKMQDTVIVTQGKTLKITPELLQRVTKNESTLSYEWSILMAGQTKADSTYKVLANTRNLEITTDNLIAQADYYPLYYKITDAQTGITYRKIIQLQVITAYQSGWVVLEQNGISTDIGFVNIAADKTYHNLFLSANGIALPSTASNTTNIVVSASTTLPKSTFTTVLSNNDGYILDNGTFKILGKYATLFSNPPSVIQSQYMRVEATNDVSTINNGKLHRRYASNGQASFGPAYNVTDGSDYFLSDKVGYVSFGIVYFDEINHRFLKETYRVSSLAPFEGTTSPFDPNDVQKDILSMKVGARNTVYALMKNLNDDECFLYGFNNGYPYTAPVSLANCPDIHLSPNYLFPTNRNQIYYAVANNLYLYDMTSDTAEIIYSFPTDENITALEMKDNNTFAIATYNGTGAIYNIALEATGQLVGGTYTSVYTGFGKVINLSYRK